MRHAGHLRACSRIVSAKMRRAAVGDVVAIDRGDDDVLQAERADGVGDARRLVEVERRRPPVRHGAIAARARADVAENHEGGGAVVPALADVRAARLLAHRVQAEARASAA